MAKVTITTRLEQCIQATGLKISSMDTAGRSGPTRARTKVASRTASKKALVISCGLTVLDTKGNGVTIKCMERVFLNGLTGESTKAATSLTKNMGTAFTLGQTEESMKAISHRAGSMERVSIHRQTRISSIAFGML